MVSLGNLCGMSPRLHWLQGSFMLPQHGGDFLTQPRRVALSRSLTKRSATATYQVVLKMYIVLSIIWNLNFSIVFCLIRGMSCTNYYLLKRILDIACGHVPITLLCLSLIIIWSGRIFCIESYLWIPTRCMCRCISTYWCLYVCMFILTYCIVCTLFAGLFTWLISIFVLIFMLLSLSAFVRFLLKKLLACLLAINMGASRNFCKGAVALSCDVDVNWNKVSVQDSGIRRSRGTFEDW